jgi:hypothetical protein
VEVLPVGSGGNDDVRCGRQVGSTRRASMSPPLILSFACDFADDY